MATGIAKWCSEKKGHGFIQQREDPDMFVHHSGILCTGSKFLYEGDRVTFDTAHYQKGPAKKNVSRA